MAPIFDVVLRFAKLGFTSFGGPIAHLGYFRREFVERARWLDDAAYGEIVALCTALPGPTSSQVGMLLGTLRAGPLGALAAWLAFTLPSALALGALGLLAARVPCMNCADVAPALRAAFVALGYVAAAVVLLALLNMARSILTTPFARNFAVVAGTSALILAFALPQLSWLTLAIGGLAGALFAKPSPAPAAPLAFTVPRVAGLAALAVLLVLLFALPPLIGANPYGRLFVATFRSGALVFGGGHVVLAFLGDMVNAREVSGQAFEAGYGATQAMPGPLFTFSAFLGATDRAVDNHILGAAVATLGIFLPSFLILPAALVTWKALRTLPRAGSVLTGLNVAVVGMLAAAFVTPIGTSLWPHKGAPFYALDPLIGVAAFILLWRAQWPAWSVVLTCAASAALYESVAARVLPAFLNLA